MAWKACNAGSEGRDLFGPNTEPLGDHFEGTAVWTDDFFALNASDLFRGDRAEVTPLQTPLLPQPHERCTKRPLAFPALLFELAAVRGLEFVEDCVGRGLVVTEDDRPAIVREAELGDVGLRTVPRLLDIPVMMPPFSQPSIIDLLQPSLHEGAGASISQRASAPTTSPPSLVPRAW